MRPQRDEPFRSYLRRDMGEYARMMTGRTGPVAWLVSNFRLVLMGLFGSVMLVVGLSTGSWMVALAGAAAAAVVVLVPVGVSWIGYRIDNDDGGPLATDPTFWVLVLLIVLGVAATIVSARA